MSEVEVVFNNKDATAPLVVPVQVICNTPFEVLSRNIIENSTSIRDWIKTEEAHDGIALMCGSGPSIKDDLKEIKEKNGTIFSLNAACRFLNENGIIPDYQVIIDAKKENKDLIGDAGQHLFCSTVDPSLFKIKTAKLFQLQIEDEETQLAVDKAAPYDFASVYSSVSVGLTAAALAYAMGYRVFHFYGYDSSHNGYKSHVIEQPMNDDNPCMTVNYNGREYYSSIAMKLQADRFQELALSLRANGCEIYVHGHGLLPDMYNRPTLSEQEKYTRLWSLNDYRVFSPAENIVKLISEKLPMQGRTIDFGCGSGRAASKLRELGYDVLLVDFADNCRDPDARSLPFLQWDLTKELPVKGVNGYCVDVMEHIQEDNVGNVINNIMNAASLVFFQISTVDDVFGAVIGQKLHLTVKPLEWWVSKFEGLGYTIDWKENNECTCALLVRNNA